MRPVVPVLRPRARAGWARTGRAGASPVSDAAVEPLSEDVFNSGYLAQLRAPTYAGGVCAGASAGWSQVPE